MANGSVEQIRNPYGDELRKRREMKGWTQDELGDRAVLSRSHLAHIEAGRRFPSPDDADRLDQVLETGGVFRRFLPDKRIASFFEGVAQLEPLATVIRQFSNSLVPGLLQTAEYTEAVFDLTYPRLGDRECADQISIRQERAQILNNPLLPELWALLDESVLRRTIGGPLVMARQLRHIAELAHKRIRLHVIPLDCGGHALIEGNVKLMSFEDMAPIYYTEGPNTGTVVDTPAVVERTFAAYHLALGDALSRRDSLALIRAVAEEYETCTAEGTQSTQQR